MASMQTLSIVLAVSTAAALQVSQLKVKGASEKVSGLKGSVAYAVDSNGYESQSTRNAMNEEAKEWLTGVAKSHSKIGTLKKNQQLGYRNFEQKQADRRARYHTIGMRDLYQEKIDEFARNRKEVEKSDAREKAKAVAVGWGTLGLGRQPITVPHYTYSNKLLIKRNADEAVLVRSQIAVTEQDTHTGLMFQESIPEDAGMLFVFHVPQSQVLYMKNTKVPLQVGWFDKNGILLELMDLKPYDEKWRWTKSDQAVIALEMNEGFFQTNDIVPGTAQLDMEEVCNTLAGLGNMNYDLCASHQAARNNGAI